MIRLLLVQDSLTRFPLVTCLSTCDAALRSFAPTGKTSLNGASRCSLAAKHDTVFLGSKLPYVRIICVDSVPLPLIYRESSSTTTPRFHVHPYPLIWSRRCTRSFEGTVIVCFKLACNASFGLQRSKICAAISPWPVPNTVQRCTGYGQTVGRIIPNHY